MSKRIVTKESLTEMLERDDEAFVTKVIGRALVHLFNRQTEDEKRVNDTRMHNAEGFTPADAHSGCITAKYFLKHGKLLDWQIEMWTKKNAKGTPRLAKYHGQLDKIARGI